MTDTKLGLEWSMGERLRKAREHAKLSAEEMAERLGCHVQTVWNYERGRTLIRRPALEVWSDATGVSIGWLLGEET